MNATLAGVVVFVGIAASGWWYYTTMAPPVDPEQAFCTADAMQCPDGSWVGRTGPNCEFVCPESDSAGGSILPYNSGIRGVVMIGPTCPVETTPPDPNCADKPAALFVNVFRGTAGERVAIVESDSEGKFEFSLPPGTYVVGTGEMGPPTCPRQEVVVEPDTYETIVLSCDSGIR